MLQVNLKYLYFPLKNFLYLYASITLSLILFLFLIIYLQEDKEANSWIMMLCYLFVDLYSLH